MEFETSQSFADVTADASNTTKSFSITCNTINVGNVTFTATGDITSADGANSNVSITKVVSVVAPRAKETEARLASLGVDGYVISFDKDKDSYSISVAPSVNAINITASAISGRASIVGAGYKELSPEGGRFEIVCTAENGARKVYVINVSVIDDNPISATIDNGNYTVVKSNKLLKAPTGTVEEKIKIKDIEVPAYRNQNTNIFIVGIKDSQSNIKYAIYDNDEYKLYNENKSLEMLLFISKGKLDKYRETTVKINEVDYPAYELNERFKIVYAMNLYNGEYNYYKYDTKENTYQYFEIEKEEAPKVEKEENISIYVITTIVFLFTTLFFAYYLVYFKIKVVNALIKKNK